MTEHTITTKGATPLGPKPVPDTAITRLARFVVGHRRLVMVVWLLLFPAGIYGASHVSNRLSLDFSLPGQPGYETAKQITHLYGNGGDSPPSVVVVTLPAGQSVRGDRAQLAQAFEHARAAVPRARIVDLAVTHDTRFVTAGGHSTAAVLLEDGKWIIEGSSVRIEINAKPTMIRITFNAGCRQHRLLLPEVVLVR